MKILILNYCSYLFDKSGDLFDERRGWKGSEAGVDFGMLTSLKQFVGCHFESGDESKGNVLVTLGKLWQIQTARTVRVPALKSVTAVTKHFLLTRFVGSSFSYELSEPFSLNLSLLPFMDNCY